MFQDLKRLRQHFSRSRVPHHKDVPILQVSNVYVSYDSGVAISDINFTVNAGDSIAIVGPNGAGKSTLLKTIAGIQDADNGNVQIFGHDPGGHICIAYVPQRKMIDWQFPVDVTDVVMMGRISQIGLFRKTSKLDRKAVREALKLVGMEQYKDRQINELSVGQQQRMFIARALAQETELLLMDEPLNGLDASYRKEIFDILDQLKSMGVTVLSSHHDLDVVSEYFEKVMLLNNQIIQIGMINEVLTSENLSIAYGTNVI
ncbi:MAG TPA: manganese ABC transporter ATP-binding protein [Chloroflexi bacterium]|nr:manganese ABC transporter ATP-binding protein [Chloroflexota bacterium]|tara:strand:+ start:762 stop:1538 length:777 start_codon:yes stop_codon:yes gene_type:complete